MRLSLRFAVIASTLVAASGCGDAGDADPSMADAGGDEYVAPEATLEWEKVEIPGTVCGDGSPYKFFISRSIGGTNSDNLLIYMEPGGACWDYPSCAGDRGIRGAANPDGIPDDHMTGGDGGVPWSQAAPLLRRNQVENPAWDWTLVFIPYCTGDVHAGDRTITYVDEDTGEELPWHHNGRANVQAAIDWLDGEYSTVPQMLVTGCSAGGAGAISNYYFFRHGITGADRGYLLADSGPIFPAAGPDDWSYELHQEIKEAWGVGDLLDSEFPQYDLSDFGNINELLAQEFPDDRLVHAFFQMDYNYSLYSYERFQFNGDDGERAGLDPSTDEYREWIYTMWWEDTLALRERLDDLDNFAYYLPFYREFNDSHCLTPLTWGGTEIEEDDMDLQTYTEHLLNDAEPLRSHFEDSCDDPARYDDEAYAALTPKCQ
ncbi:MAG: pectin acetylesterase-family hydrolase [Myxococcota bacterium]